MSAPLLVVQNLSSGAISDISLDIAPRETVALLGPNGAGKSTLLESVMGLRPAVARTLHFDGRDIAGLSPAQRARAGIGYVPQGRRLFPGVTVRDTLLLASFAAARQRARRIESVLELFPDLSARLDTRAWQLSGGQQQMLAIGRALMAEPRLLLLDEPSTGLAPKLVSALMARLPRIAEGGTAILLAEQNARAALTVSSRACVLSEGRLAHEGRARDLTADPAMRASLLGIG